MWTNILDEAKQRKLKRTTVKELIDNYGKLEISKNKLLFYIDDSTQKIGGKFVKMQ